MSLTKNIMHFAVFSLLMWYNNRLKIMDIKNLQLEHSNSQFPRYQSIVLINFEKKTPKRLTLE